MAFTLQSPQFRCRLFRLNVGALEFAAELYDSRFSSLQILPAGVMSLRHFLFFSLSFLTLSKCPDFIQIT